MYLNYVYDMDRHGGLVTAEPHWARNENAHAVVSVRKAGKEMKEMTHTYVVYVQLTKKGNICLVGNRLLLWLLARARVLGGPGSNSGTENPTVPNARRGRPQPQISETRTEPNCLVRR